MSRKLYEAIHIFVGGVEVVVTVVDIGGNKVRIGVTADPSVKIYRSEILPEDRRRAD